MRVVAISRGYLGQVREPGDEFEAPEKLKGSWFKAVKADDDKPRKAGAPPSKAELLKAEAMKADADKADDKDPI